MIVDQEVLGSNPDSGTSPSPKAYSFWAFLFLTSSRFERPAFSAGRSWGQIPTAILQKVEDINFQPFLF